MSDLKTKRSYGLLIALSGVFLMSMDPIYIRFSGVGGFDTAFLFGLFTAISMPIFIQILDKRGLIQAIKASGWPVLFSGLLMLGSASVFSVKNTSVANTFVILSSAPVWSAIFSWLFLREKTRRSTWISIIFVIIGVLVVVSGSFETGHLLGDLLAVFAIICISSNQTLLRRYKNVSRMASVGAGGLLLAIVMFFFAEPASFSSNTWIIMGAMGLFTAPLGRVIAQVSTRYISAAELGMIMMVEAVFAPLWSFAFFREVPARASILGGAIMFTSVLIYIISTRKQQD